MPEKVRVGLLFGGKSAEHDVSLQSAQNILDAIDTEKYEVVLVGIDRTGQWFLNEGAELLLPEAVAGQPADEDRALVTLIPEGKEHLCGLRILGR